MVVKVKFILLLERSYKIAYFLILAPYVKVYIIDGKNCIEKQKTTVARRTLDPLYQQQLVFTENYVGKILQVYNNLSSCAQLYAISSV